MGFELNMPNETVPYETAAEALAAYTPDTTGIWVDGHTITHGELKCMAEQEAKAPDPEEFP